MMARTVQASTSIEGYHSTVDETAAIIDSEEPPGWTRTPARLSPATATH